MGIILQSPASFPTVRLSDAQEIFYVFLIIPVLLLCVVVRRLWFHPLSKFPGPKLAAATSWYDLYYDLFLNGSYVKDFPKLHERYDHNEKESDIIRIAPNHLHINDLDFYKTVFHAKAVYQKAPSFYGNLSLGDSLVSQTDESKHHIKRTVVNSTFSTKAVNDIAPSVAQKVQKAGDLIALKAQRGQPITIQQVFRCITADVICDISFGVSKNLVESNEEYPAFLTGIDEFASRMRFTKNFPILGSICLHLPNRVKRHLLPGHINLAEQCKPLVENVLEQNQEKSAHQQKKTMFHLLREPDQEKNHPGMGFDALINEALLFTIGGSHTTAYTLSYAIYHVLSAPEILSRLRTELEGASAAINEEFDWHQIKNLPYLTAVIKETLRVSSGIPGNLPRVVPAEGILAYMEIYLCLAIFFLRFDMELFETDETSIEWSDFVLAVNRKPVKVRITKDHLA
ncbi:hypothetical protein ANOM_002461 [Aspergillus nomiae NRRL 13137]|uniref:Cytochrome P450 n=1 Tax=Aspergillus nomiae NRRL (strain ATCC 15546 / NRRL 13137 / CBS 260.88 / M93) TaxID=1509407 RepID=A0A0L1JAM3_ASPN3|nr:uncharacterized protein ANOM_002461 [Aspergillus nomiae NRRL 13137]KNG88804.1 hypothetical protein ANOM_002461 [Aspergillus nomiae NRRL 13137]